MVNPVEKSDAGMVPKKSAKTWVTPVESMEGRPAAKGKSVARNTSPTERGSDVDTAMQRIGQRAKEKPKEKWTNLLTHIRVPLLARAYLRLRKDAATGVDAMTWAEYGERLDERLRDLEDRIHRGNYHPQPVRRVHIPKGDGRMRPLGIPALEDKVVQQAAKMVLEPIYEAEFLGLSYGFRPGRGAHGALDALAAAIDREVHYFACCLRECQWHERASEMGSACLQSANPTLRCSTQTSERFSTPSISDGCSGYFRRIGAKACGLSARRKWGAPVYRARTQPLVEHRIGDSRMVRLLMKWMHAGVMEDGKLRRTQMGTPQGGIISPLLANIYLHYALDLWVMSWRKTKARGGVVYLVRYADDFVMGFQFERDARAMHSALVERLAKFNLELHSRWGSRSVNRRSPFSPRAQATGFRAIAAKMEKTRVLQFGRYARADRERHGLSKPETFDFLGFTHISGKSRGGGFQLKRRTSRKKRLASLARIKEECRRRRHHSEAEQYAWLTSALNGHYRYYGVPSNSRSLEQFRFHVERTWHRSLQRRSQRGHWTSARTTAFRKRFPLPRSRIHHPWPTQRFAAR